MMIIADNQKGGVNLTEQSRTIWKFQDYFTEKWKNYPVTFIVCQRNTKKIIQLCLESLLRFYPDVNVIVVDDNSDDQDSKLYLKFKELTTPNLKVIWNGSTMGHGSSLHIAMTQCTTGFAFLLDSDIIVERGNFLEEMLPEFDRNSKLYALGARQLTSYANNGGQPNDDNDAISYGNPQACMYHVPTYFELVEEGTNSRGQHVPAPMLTDGTPCILNNKAAHDAGFEIKYFPIEYYISHNGSSSWSTPPSVWIDDHDTFTRPFLTIIMKSRIDFWAMSDNDFDVVYISDYISGEYTFTDGSPKFTITNSFRFPMRFNVTGEYILDLTDYNEFITDSTFITRLKQKVNELNIPDELELDGFTIYKRQYWQKTVR